jgi:transketolase
MLKSDLASRRNSCARKALELYYKASAGHVGAGLSCLEVLVDLCFQRAQPDDVIMLSKGHAAAALYTCLALSGRMDEDYLDTFYKDGTTLAAHPPCTRVHKAIPFGTGSLGHGLSLGAGMAFSQRFTNREFKVFVILSDGDCNEGSTWEAALFAAHHRLQNLTVIVDRNGLQGIGRSDDILGLEPLVEKWEAFGFATAVAENGNDFDSLNDGYRALESTSGQPRCLLARTVKGHGVPFMSDRMEWHYLPMSAEQYEMALHSTLGGSL